jgi:hypothetical protein
MSAAARPQSTTLPAASSFRSGLLPPPRISRLGLSEQQTAEVLSIKQSQRGMSSSLATTPSQPVDVTSAAVPSRKEPLQRQGDIASHRSSQQTSSPSSRKEANDLNFVVSSKQILVALGCSSANKGPHHATPDVREMRQWLLHRVAATGAASTQDRGEHANSRRRPLPFWAAWLAAQSQQHHDTADVSSTSHVNIERTQLPAPTVWQTVHRILFRAPPRDLKRQEQDRHHSCDGNTNEVEDGIHATAFGGDEDDHDGDAAHPRPSAEGTSPMLLPSASELLRSAHKPIAVLCARLCRPSLSLPQHLKKRIDRRVSTNDPPDVFKYQEDGIGSSDSDGDTKRGVSPHTASGNNDDQGRMEQEAMIAVFRLLYDAPRSSRRVHEVVTTGLEPSTPLRITPSLVHYVWTMLLAVLAPASSNTPTSRSDSFGESIDAACRGVWDELDVEAETAAALSGKKRPGGGARLLDNSITASTDSVFYCPATSPPPSVLLFAELTEDPKHAWYCCCTMWFLQLMNLSAARTDATTSSTSTSAAERRGASTEAGLVPVDGCCFTTLRTWLTSATPGTIPAVGHYANLQLPTKSNETVWRLLDSTIAISSTSPPSSQQQHNNDAVPALAALGVLRSDLHEGLCVWLELITKIVRLVSTVERDLLNDAAQRSRSTVESSQRGIDPLAACAALTPLLSVTEAQRSHACILRALVVAVLHPSYTVALSPISIGGPRASATGTGGKKRGFGAATVPEVHSRTLTQLREAGERRGAREAEDRDRLRRMSRAESDRVTRSAVLREATEEALHMQRTLGNRSRRRPPRCGDAVEVVASHIREGRACNDAVATTTTTTTSIIKRGQTAPLSSATSFLPSQPPATSPPALHTTGLTTSVTTRPASSLSTHDRYPFAAVSRMLQSYDDALGWRRKHRTRDDAIHERQWAREVSALSASAKVKTYYS